MTNVNDLLGDHVTLTVDWMDRIYLNGNVPTLQVGGQLDKFLTTHLGNQIPWPVLLGKRGDQFRKGVQNFAQEKYIPMVRFERGQGKDEVAGAYRRKISAEEGVVLIGVAQERAKSFKARKKDKKG